MDESILTAISMYEMTKDMSTFTFVLDLIVVKYNMSVELKESIIKSAQKIIPLYNS
jgi:hypothetical protein